MTEEQFQMLIEVRRDLKMLIGTSRSTRRIARRAHRRLDVLDAAATYRAGALALGSTVLVAIASVVGGLAAWAGPLLWDWYHVPATFHGPPSAPPAATGKP